MMEQQKILAVVIPGGADGAETILREVTVIPGTTAQDVLNTLGKGAGFILGTLEGTVFKPRDLVFTAVEDSEKLVITPSAEAGASAPAFFRFLRELLGLPDSGSAPQYRSPGPGSTSSRVATPGKRVAASVGSHSRLAAPQSAVSARPSLVATPARVVKVSPNIQPPWKEKGWREVTPGVYEGGFQCPFGTFRGRVEFGRHGFQHTYIWRPPAELWNSRHPKAVCFSSEGRGKYQVHMHDIPPSVDAAILNVERILDEAFELWCGGRHAYR